MKYNILKNIFLGLFGIAIIAILLTIASYFDETIAEDKFLFAYTSITWSIYIACKIVAEDYKNK